MAHYYARLAERNIIISVLLPSNIQKRCGQPRVPLCLKTPTSDVTSFKHQQQRQPRPGYKELDLRDNRLGSQDALPMALQQAETPRGAWYTSWVGN